MHPRSHMRATLPSPSRNAVMTLQGQQLGGATRKMRVTIALVLIHFIVVVSIISNLNHVSTLQGISAHPPLTCWEQSVACPPQYNQPCHAVSPTTSPRLGALSVVTSTVASRLPWGLSTIQQWSSDTWHHDHVKVLDCAQQISSGALEGSGKQGMTGLTEESGT